MEPKVCYQFQCPKYRSCALAAGVGCCLEREPTQWEVPSGDCTKANGFPFFRQGKAENPVHAWLRGERT